MSRFLFAQPGLLSYRFDRQDRLTMPVLVVAGREDYQIGLAPQEALGNALPNAHLMVVEHAGHFPYVDEPDEFAEGVLSFLAQVRR